MTGRAPPFEDKYIPEPMSGCWLWLGYVNRDGYGTLTHHGRVYMAHRFSWALHRGEIPSGMLVLHKCDTPACINPDHLFLGTHTDNQADKMRKGRYGQYGEDNNSAKLTEADALFIREDLRKPSVIAKDYGVSRQIVWKIKTRQNWAHL
jgi:hypothetical protein